MRQRDASCKQGKERRANHCALGSVRQWVQANSATAHCPHTPFISDPVGCFCPAMGVSPSHSSNTASASLSLLEPPASYLKVSMSKQLGWNHWIIKVGKDPYNHLVQPSGYLWRSRLQLKSPSPSPEEIRKTFIQAEQQPQGLTWLGGTSSTPTLGLLVGRLAEEGKPCRHGKQTPHPLPRLTPAVLSRSGQEK